jgi:hypothetical protein
VRLERAHRETDHGMCGLPAEDGIIVSWTVCPVIGLLITMMKTVPVQKNSPTLPIAFTTEIGKALHPCQRILPNWVQGAQRQLFPSNHSPRFKGRFCLCAKIDS